MKSNTDFDSGRIGRVNHAKKIPSVENHTRVGTYYARVPNVWFFVNCVTRSCVSLYAAASVICPRTRVYTRVRNDFANVREIMSRNDDITATRESTPGLVAVVKRESRTFYQVVRKYSASIRQRTGQKRRTEPRWWADGCTLARRPIRVRLFLQRSPPQTL